MVFVRLMVFVRQEVYSSRSLFVAGMHRQQPQISKFLSRQQTLFPLFQRRLSSILAKRTELARDRRKETGSKSFGLANSNNRGVQQSAKDHTTGAVLKHTGHNHIDILAN